MKTIGTMSKCAFVLFVSCFSIFLIRGISYSAEAEYPMKVEIIDKDQARYDTPENAFIAGLSALTMGILNGTMKH